MSNLIKLHTFLLLFTALMLGVSGCSEATKRKMRWRKPTMSENYRIALEHKDGDERRDAVVRIAKGPRLASEETFRVLDAVARTDPITQVRCIAIRALAGYYDARPLSTVLAILQAKEDTGDALPANADIRWEIVSTLVALERRGIFDDQQRKMVCDLFIELSKADYSRNVRIVATKALGLFKRREVLDPLVSALRDEDFAIAEQGEMSLITLTGVTQHYDADAWQAWLDNASDPFEKAGQIPQTTRPAGPTWFDKQARAWKRALKMQID